MTSETADRLPTFFGDKAKDTLSAEDWASRAIALQQSAAWSNEKAVNECRLALRGRAAVWYAGLKYCRSHLFSDFLEFISAFRRDHDVQQKPEDLLLEFAELKQQPNERVTEFYNRCVYLVMRRLDIIPRIQLPASLTNNQGVVMIPNFLEELRNFREECYQAFSDVTLLHYFLGGLKPEIRGRLLEKCCQSHDEAKHQANLIQQAMESQANKTIHAPQVFQAADGHGGSVNATSNNQGNGNNRGKGKKKGKGKGKGNNGNGNGNNAGSKSNSGPSSNPGPHPFQAGQRISRDTCAYCQKKNHWQKACAKRIADGQPMVKVFAISAFSDEYGEPPKENWGPAMVPLPHYPPPPAPPTTPLSVNMTPLLQQQQQILQQQQQVQMLQLQRQQMQPQGPHTPQAYMAQMPHGNQSQQADAHLGDLMNFNLSEN